MDVFNDREIALAIWAVLFFSALARDSAVRQAFYTVVQRFFVWRILTVFSLMILYMVLLVLELHELGLWDIGQLKNTVYWSLSIAALSLFRITEIAEELGYFKTLIKNHFTAIAVLEFIIAAQTGPLWAELVIVPIASLLVAMHAIAASKKEFDPVGRIIGFVLSTLGLAILIWALYRVLLDIVAFMQISTLTDFSLPPLLTVLYLPFLFLLKVVINYQELFVRLPFVINDEPLRRYAKWRSLTGFHCQTSLLRRWHRHLQIRAPESKQDIRDSIHQVKTLKQRERDPPAVPIEQGWSPYAAMRFLIDEGLTTRDYHPESYATGEWCANGNPTEIGDKVLPDSITYYIEGHEHAATVLKLVLNVNEAKRAQRSQARFINLAMRLFEKALSEPMPERIEKALWSETETTEYAQGKEIVISRESFPRSRLGGYTARFVIRNPRADETGQSE